MATANKTIRYEVLGATPTSSRRSVDLAHREKESGWRKYLVFAILLPPFISTLLVVLALNLGWRIHGPAQEWINDNRATTQIIVQLASGILGVCNVLVARKLINFSSRLALCKQAISLDTLKLLSALSIDRFDFSLHSRHLPILVFFSTITILPAALWAGALTPVDATNVVRDTYTTISPAYTAASHKYWIADWYGYNGTKVRNHLGTFSYAPPLHRYGYLHSDGAAASSLDGSPQSHLKNDRSNFTYVGRSYGVGSLVGLEEKTDLRLAKGVQGYSYHEMGYLGSVNCTYNASSLFDLVQITNSTL